MVFVDSPWKHYVEDDQAALTNEQKQGAILFFTPIRQGGACRRYRESSKPAEKNVQYFFLMHSRIPNSRYRALLLGC
jgi:cytochrome c peroxidase